VRVAILSGVLFLSGISALIFETLWLRLSGLAFGNSVWSAALILSSFMAGLALGSAIAAYSNVRQLRPLRVYASLELAVALFGCTLVFGLPVLGAELRPFFQALWNQDSILNGLRFFLSFLILLVPTTAMGLTLPVLLGDPILRRHHFARTIGLLYGFNTLGAVAGAVMGEAYLVKAFGLLGTALVAGAGNCVAAAIAWLMAKVDSGSLEIAPESATRSRLKIDYRLTWRPLIVSFGTGGVLLCLEVVWFRFLRLYVASSPTAFSVMLAVVLAGIGLGAIAAGAFHRHFAHTTAWLPVLLILAAMATLLSYLFFPTLQQSDFYLDTWREIALLSLALMFPVAFFSGALFPLIVASVQARVENRMNSTGVTTLFNTTGAAIGPLLASFVLLPNIGFQRALILCAVVYVLLAVLMSERQNWSPTRPPGMAMVGLCLIAIMVVAFFPYHRDEVHFAHARQPYQTDGSYLIKKIEGTSDTLQLLRRDLYGEAYYYRLVTNAFTMSDTRYQNQRYMRLFAYLPLTLCPESKDALLICYGCGVTADALVHDSQLKRIDIVDISKEVFRLADFYSGANYSNPLRDPRVTRFVQDGRFFLQASPRHYDVITGEPPPPKVAGTVNLYTEEFFALMKSRLKDGGIATFWLPINQLKVEEAKAILRAFHNAFSNASVWASSDYEWIMMGMNGPPRTLNQNEARRLWDGETTRADLKRIGIEVPEQLAALFVMDSGEIDRITHGTKPLTDFFPKRLSDAPADLEDTHRFAWDYMQADAAVRRFRSSRLMENIWREAMPTSLEPFFLVRETRYFSEAKGSNRLAELDFYLRHTQLQAPVWEALNSDGLRLSIAERLSESKTPPDAALPDLVAGALAQRDFNKAIQLLETERAHGFAKRNDIFLLIYLYCLNGKVENAEALATASEPMQKDWFVDWLWGKLQAEFGFRPPR
jgi:spermidine synthase